jgi:hypothetical protein
MPRLVLAALLFPSMVLAIAAQQPAAATTAAQDPFPEATGKAPLVKVCSNCHSAESVIQTLRTRQEWSDVIDQMSRFGAEATDKEFDQILTYLAMHFSPIRVNKVVFPDPEGPMIVVAVPRFTSNAFLSEKHARSDVFTSPGTGIGVAGFLRRASPIRSAP